MLVYQRVSGYDITNKNGACGYVHSDWDEFNTGNSPARKAASVGNV